MKKWTTGHMQISDCGMRRVRDKVYISYTGHANTIISPKGKGITISHQDLDHSEMLQIPHPTERGYVTYQKIRNLDNELLPCPECVFMVTALNAALEAEK